MKITNQINNIIPGLIKELKESIINECNVETRDHLGLAGRTEIYEMLDCILSILFPARYSKEQVPKDELALFLSDIIQHIIYKFQKHIKEVLHYRCEDDKCDHCGCDDRAYAILFGLLESLPSIRRMLIEDVKAGYESDPAATSMDEIVLSYPYIDAVATYRIAHTLYREKVPIIPRIMTERAHSNTGIDIHPGAEIGPGLFIDHGTGVVIGETTRIGRNVKIYQGVTLGVLSPFDKNGRPRKGEKRHPDIEDDVIIYANATILGGKTVIGKGAIIGGNTWITSSVPPGAIVYHNVYAPR